MMKKVLSFVLTVVMVMSMSVTAFAGTLPMNSVKSDDEAYQTEISFKVNSLVETFNSDNQEEVRSTVLETLSFFPAKNLTKITESDGKIWSEFTLDSGLKSKIAIEESEKGKKYIIVEGNLTNELLIKEDGNIEIDGVPIEFEEKITFISLDDLQKQATVAPLGLTSDYQYFDKCLYGSPADYTRLVISSTVADAKLEKKLQKLTVAAVNYMVFKFALKIDLTLLDKFSNEIGLFMSAVSIFSEDAIDTYPTSQSLSYKRSRFVHGTEGYYISSKRYSVEKHDLQLYPKKNFAGKATKVTIYERFLPNI